MSTTPITQDQWTIHALNIHGVFFERRCAVAVAETVGWKVLTTNYPVEYPPPNGSLRGKESSLDIWARKEADANFVFDALIECKKANPDFVNWVFFPRQDSTPSSKFSFAHATNTPNPSGSGPWTSELQIRHGATPLDLASDAREVRGDYVKHQGGNKTKTSNAAIQEAAYQVALACRAIVSEESSLLSKARKSPDHPAPPWVAKAYIPIIVTTAQLLRVDFSQESTDLASGEIALTDATLTPVQSIVYEYALPKHLQYSPAKPLEVLKTGDTDTFSRLHIIVVSAGQLSSFLREHFSDQKEDI
ncbi:MAG: hypothetical protein AABY62_02750 [Pseudomonadota bacterium]